MIDVWNKEKSSYTSLYFKKCVLPVLKAVKIILKPCPRGPLPSVLQEEKKNVIKNVIKKCYSTWHLLESKVCNWHKFKAGLIGECYTVTRIKLKAKVKGKEERTHWDENGDGRHNIILINSIGLNNKPKFLNIPCEERPIGIRTGYESALLEMIAQQQISGIYSSQARKS